MNNSKKYEKRVKKLREYVYSLNEDERTIILSDMLEGVYILKKILDEMKTEKKI